MDEICRNCDRKKIKKEKEPKKEKGIGDTVNIDLYLAPNITEKKTHKINNHRKYAVTISKNLSKNC